MGKEMKKKAMFPLVVLLLSVFASMVYAGDLCKFLRFDGTDDYAVIADNASLNMSGGDMTIEFWMRTDTPAVTATLFAKSNVGWSVWFYCLLYSDEIEWMVMDADGYYDFDYSDALWHHILAIFDNTDDQLELWIDGVNQTATAGSFFGPVGNYDSNGELLLGAEYDTPVEIFYEGDMDEFRVYSRKLSEAEIAYSFANKEPQDETDLELWLKMDDETGDTATDETANNNDGTLSPDYPSNAPEWIDETPSIPAGEAAGDAMEEAGLTMATIMTVFVILWGLSGEGELHEVLSYLVAIAVILIIASVVKGIG